MSEKPVTILLVDDDVDFVRATKTILESRPGYRVVVAYSGRQGLERARQDRPDIILLDIIMPAEDGFAVCEKLRQDPDLADTPVLMLTSFSDRYAETSIPVSRGYALEADDYISKPIRPEELHQRIDQQLKKRR